MVAQAVKNLTVMQETWVRSLGQEDPLEKGMATHSSILAWWSPWTEEPGGLQLLIPYGGCKESDMTEATEHTHAASHWFGFVVSKAADKVPPPGLIPRLGRSPREGNGNPLQYSCLENPTVKGDWRAMVHRITKSQT